MRRGWLQETLVSLTQSQARVLMEFLRSSRFTVVPLTRACCFVGSCAATFTCVVLDVCLPPLNHALRRSFASIAAPLRFKHEFRCNFPCLPSVATSTSQCRCSHRSLLLPLRRHVIPPLVHVVSLFRDSQCQILIYASRVMCLETCAAMYAFSPIFFNGCISDSGASPL